MVRLRAGELSFAFEAARALSVGKCSLPHVRSPGRFVFCSGARHLCRLTECLDFSGCFAIYSTVKFDRRSGINALLA